MSTGVASRSKVLVTKKLELLVLLNQLEIVERNVWRVARPLRLKFQSIILNWRKHLGYSALSSATAGFDKETLLKLQELFAELDADGVTLPFAAFSHNFVTLLPGEQLESSVEVLWAWPEAPSAGGGVGEEGAAPMPHTACAEAWNAERTCVVLGGTGRGRRGNG